MSKVAEERHNWLDQVKVDAERNTKRRLEDDGFDSHVERVKEINEAEARVQQPKQETKVVDKDEKQTAKK